MSFFSTPVGARPTYLAGGNIRPARILQLANTGLAIEATASTGQPFIGVSLNATKYPPGSTEDNGFTQTSGFAVPYQGQGDICYAIAGATINVVDTNKWLTTDNAGRVIVVPASGSGTSMINVIGRVLLSSLTPSAGTVLAREGDLIPIVVDIRTLPGNVSTNP